MRARGICVDGVLAGDPFLTALHHVSHEFLSVRDVDFLKADEVDVVFVVLPQFEFVAFVEEVIEFPAVDLVEGESGFEMSEVRLCELVSTLARYSKMSLAPSAYIPGTP